MAECPTTQRTKTSIDNYGGLMPRGGLEPPCQLRHNALNVACLPISPTRQNFIYPLGMRIMIQESSCIVKCFSWHLQNSSPEYSLFSLERRIGAWQQYCIKWYNARRWMHVYIRHIEADFLAGNLAKKSRFEREKLTLSISYLTIRR